MPSISYAICVCNEIIEIEILLNQIFQYIREEDEVVVLFDSENGTKEVETYLNKVNLECEFKKINFHRIYHNLNKNFASHKNFLKQHCSKEWMVQIDADEYFHDNLIQNIPAILETNNVDIILVPRINIVNDLTQGDIQQWRWRLDEQNRVNYPDFQHRIFKNKEEIKWINKVHEQIIGYQSLSSLPYDVDGWQLIHIKDIDRQRKQNNFYNTI